MGKKQSKLFQSSHHPALPLFSSASYTKSHGFGTVLDLSQSELCPSFSHLPWPWPWLTHSSWLHCFTSSPLRPSSFCFSSNKSHVLSFHYSYPVTFAFDVTWITRPFMHPSMPFLVLLPSMNRPMSPTQQPLQCSPISHSFALPHAMIYSTL